MKKNDILLTMIGIILPLSLGFACYLFLFPDSHFSFFARRVFDTDLLIRKEWIADYSGWLFLRYYLCDFLWGISLASFVHLFFRERVMPVIITILVGTAFELFQLEGVADGTFDYYDIIAYAMGATVSLLLKQKHSKE